MGTPQLRRQPHSADNGRSWIVFAMFAVIAAFYLLAEHRMHLLGALPYLIILLCPLMHMFHHRSHREHGSGRHDHA